MSSQAPTRRNANANTHPAPNLLSICSGIGGLDLALERVLGARAVGYVERDAYAQAVLLARMEDEALVSAPVFDDLLAFDGAAFRGVVDIVAGGIPCQPHSVAGKQGRQADERDLIDEFLRIVGEVEPGLVFVENVRGFVARDGLGRLFKLRRSELPTAESESSSWPTATCGDANSSGSRGYPTSATHNAGTTLTDASRLWPTPIDSTKGGGRVRSGERSGEMMLTGMAETWPTPCATLQNDNESPESFEARRLELKAKRINGNGAGLPLTQAAKTWPTPRATDTNGPCLHGEGGMDLRTAASLHPGPQVLAETGAESLSGAGRHWQTPRVGPHGPPGQGKRHGGQPKGLRLNPCFVEWLQGFSPQWSLAPTDCDASETLSCPPRLFEFEDFDGERITAETRIEEREWRHGTGWFKWLSLFRRPQIQRTLDLQFDKETGKRKGSWKGGTIGHSAGGPRSTPRASCAVLSAASKCPLWVAVILLALYALVEQLPIGRG